MINRKSLRLIVIIFTVGSLSLFLILYLTSAGDFDILFSASAGLILAILNFLIGYLFIKRSYSASNNLFFSMLWGGLILRLMLTLSLTFIVLKFLEINEFGFIFSLLFFYVFFLIIEILYLNLKKIEHFER